ncbi:spindle and centriole-associated protein 1 isoform X2 [Clupea harengus]|uniref:Spindle and centriole-associated protein 1 n=1 Tax=Clupea harengus TaxID=7950 RepID=A0A6P8GZV3_CLUHA|nr:spindle and centriole-associated protein 1 isoform X2 [Clupea harengus]
MDHIRAMSVPDSATYPCLLATTFSQMSFARPNRLQFGQGKRPTRPKKAAAPKKEWVTTVNDLTVHKATPEELSQRHESHKSHNRVVAQWELREKALRRRRRREQPPTPPRLDKYRLNLIREVFSDQYTLQDVLARSDRAMSVVKDLFGDAPRRQTGFPSVTVAPGGGSGPELPVLQRPDPPTQLSILSQSMMDPQALNELEQEYSDEEPDSSFNSPSDPQRFRGPSQKTKSDPERPERLDNHSPPQTPCNPKASQDQAALNATVAVERLQSRQPQPESGRSSTLVTQVLNSDSPPPCSGKKNRASRSCRGRSAASGLDGSSLSSLNGNQSSLELLQSMLGQVETELDSLDPQEPTSVPGPHRANQSLTGFSVALVSTIGRLARHLRQRDEQAQKEAQERRRLEEVLVDQRVLIDALTSEMLNLRDESAALQVGVQQRMTDLEERLDTVVLALGDLGPFEGGPEPQVSYVPVSQPPVKPPPEPPSISPAVLLSPPRQRDSQASYNRGEVCGVPLPYEASSASGSHRGSQEELDRSSSCSFASVLCPTPLMEPSLGLLPPSQDVVQAQIAKLAQQNVQMRDQLEQRRISPAGSYSSREQTSGRSSPASLSRQRTAPPSGHQPQVQQVVQCGQAAHPRATHMEERLLELSRQSAAARSRLLELIDQQRQNTSMQASPCISPIPVHSDIESPSTVTSRTPEVAMLVPERDSCSQSSGGSIRSAGVSAQHLNGVDGHRQRPQVERPRGDGWFALSAHVQ